MSRLLELKSEQNPLIRCLILSQMSYLYRECKCNCRAGGFINLDRISRAASSKSACMIISMSSCALYLQEFLYTDLKLYEESSEGVMIQCQLFIKEPNKL